MSKTQPFIPRDKPRSWVVFNLSCLVGMAAGFVAFAAAWADFPLIKQGALALFWICGVNGIIFWFVFAKGMFSGRYSNLEPRNWKEQKW